MSRHSFRDQLADQPIELAIIHDDLLSDGFRPLRKLTLTHGRLDDSGSVGPVAREFLDTGEVVVIIPYHPERDAIVVIRQFRLGSALTLDKGAAIELPAGLVDAGEEIDRAAAREMEEETGLKPLAIERCYAFLSSPGLSTEHATVFLAIVDASQLGVSAGRADENEDIRPILAPVDDLIRAVDDGWVENGHLISCVHWFARKGRAKARALLGTLTDD